MASLRQLAFISSFRVSDTFTSPPWGYDSKNEYLNVGVSFDTDLSPNALLSATRSIEQSISTASHRNADGSYADRLIDIDIIACADIDLPTGSLSLIKINTENLILPHPRALQRDFVTIPLRQIDLPLYNILTTSPIYPSPEADSE